MTTRRSVRDVSPSGGIRASRETAARFLARWRTGREAAGLPAPTGIDGIMSCLAVPLLSGRRIDQHISRFVERCRPEWSESEIDHDLELALAALATARQGLPRPGSTRWADRPDVATVVADVRAARSARLGTRSLVCC